MRTQPALRFEIVPTDDGSFQCICPGLGLRGEGATEAEAEACLLRMVDERMTQTGTLTLIPSVRDEDEPVEDDERDDRTPTAGGPI